MINTEQREVAIKALISYPHEAEVGQTYLMTIDVETDVDKSGRDWPYAEEEYALYCILDTEPLFTHEPVGKPAIILNRFGSTYGAASFLLTADNIAHEGYIGIKLINEQGVLVQTIDLENVKVNSRKRSRIKQISTDVSPKTDYQSLLQIFEQAAKENWTQLDLSRKGLAELPPQIGQLTNLTTLNLSFNRLTAVPPESGQLTRLTTLRLDGNQLTAVPPEIGQLTNLMEIDLSVNQLTVVPSWLVELPKLEKLYLSGNSITEPPQEILGWGNIDKLSNKQNDGFLGQEVDIDKIRAYFRQLAEEGSDTLYEAKLVIIGEAGAGKTTLIKKLLNPAYRISPIEPSTEGIDVAEWNFSLPHQQSTGSNEQPPIFRVNIWDFGGQEIYHATYEFFLTSRSLYIIVADARQQKTDFYYWLNVVESISGNSPVLIISNEKQNRAWDINQYQLRSRFQSLKGIFSVNLAGNDDRRLHQIIEAIKYQIAQLPHIGQVLPKTWIRVREALESDPRNAISLSEYLDLCAEYGFTRHEDKLQLSSYLHDLGVFLHFQDDPLLSGVIILKPEWGTAAVYNVLENKRVLTNIGRFSRADLTAIWHEEQYTSWEDALLQLMIRFRLCYPLPDGDYIAPQLLSEIRPEYHWDDVGNLYLRYHYPTFLPKGILTRFMVAMHQFIADQRLVWKTGVILADVGAHAEIIEHYHRREITIRVSGERDRNLLTKIADEFDKIHGEFPRLQFNQLIPCNCSVCQVNTMPHLFDYEYLKRRLAAGRTIVQCEKSYEDVNIQSLIKVA